MIQSNANNAIMDAFVTKLKSLGLKATPQRLAVHEAMINLGHASVDQVAEYISDKGSTKITLASVYNILCHLALLGIYSYRQSSANKMFFDVNTFPHFHLYDKQNDTYVDVIDDELWNTINAHLKKKKFRGYRMEGFDLNILCRQTQKRKNH